MKNNLFSDFDTLLALNNKTESVSTLLCNLLKFVDASIVRMTTVAQWFEKILLAYFKLFYTRWNDNIDYVCSFIGYLISFPESSFQISKEQIYCFSIIML